MAKNLAGLAALGALGLLMSRKQGGGEAPVEERVSTPVRTFGETPSYAADQGPDTTGQGWETEVSNPGTPAAAPSRPPVRTNRPTSGQASLTIPTLPNTPNQTYGTGRATQGPVRMVQGARPVGPANIPTSGYSPVEGGEPVDNPSEAGKILAGMGVGAGVAGLGAGAYKTKKAYDALKAADRSGVTNPNMWMAGPKEASKFGKSAKDLIKDKLIEKGLLKKELSEADTTGGAIGYKKGGPLKAKSKPKSMKLTSGGSARSSASKRGDGIASKGRTRGKMY